MHNNAISHVYIMIGLNRIPSHQPLMKLNWVTCWSNVGIFFCVFLWWSKMLTSLVQSGYKTFLKIQLLNPTFSSLNSFIDANWNDCLCWTETNCHRRLFGTSRTFFHCLVYFTLFEHAPVRQETACESTIHNHYIYFHLFSEEVFYKLSERPFVKLN